eukprot:CAMPEP_0181309214 /NCGR_PEP_ID=MMETSP1101-20121128/11894_1 /TAXON_ID=46948 /ORGANISM="Rhodomonas abbreviata, Strain Caron Lab Isolate" /LENGTH=78 /DNA_ID=CAMNT_0023415683 /DNA_START=103 /DNA_END=339 /DNA_ORIENTATION=+
MFAGFVATARGNVWEHRTLQGLDLLGAFYADNVNDGLRGNTPSCDGMGPQNNRHVGDGRYCQAEDYLSPAERAATLGV